MTSVAELKHASDTDTPSSDGVTYEPDDGLAAPGQATRTAPRARVDRPTHRAIGEADGSATAQQPPSRRGTVKWFNDPKGFGFILDGEGRDVFVHYQCIEGTGFKTLDEGETVLYDDENGPKGRRALRVVRSAGNGGAKSQRRRV